MKINPHNPEYLPPKLDYGYFAKELADAQYAIGLLQGSQAQLHNALHLIGPLVAKEAAVSSKIEGTQSTSSDIYIYDAGGAPAHLDTPVVSNYRSAMYAAVDEVLRGKKLSLHLIKSLHGKLLSGVRHKGRLGAFREGQVWIAEKEGDPIEKALYIPPEHVHVPAYMENLLEYVEKNNDDRTLVKAGVAHYQFEAVHPFDDGNGRIGRLLIPLVLFYKGELSLPIVYSSGYFEARPAEYRGALRAVDSTGKYEAWLAFFLRAITEQARETLNLISQIQNLHYRTRKKYEDSKSPYMLRLIDFLFESPAFTIPLMMSRLSWKSRATAVRLVDLLEEDGVVRPAKGQKGPGGSNLYLFSELLDLL